MPELRAGWDEVLRGAFAGQASDAALQAAAWLVEHGGRLGVRPPNVAERARGLGMGEYLPQPGLSEAREYDAQGNAFDPLAIAIRIGPGARDWSQGAPLARRSPERRLSGRCLAPFAPAPPACTTHGR